ncbi:uncharacterized protein N7503_006484 [Penicillium pulvis]|uniref:uncharacterized protein n=1 Tax=Penicillium pulvis TaxID=1562058 RepID=UPI002549788F|nr:uncharacterized protein N7503_006484 [Penicillium pulvis]KAJ5798979.1 hypothetical protein N7503_006484 [Penicillium pulvis]
MPPIRSEKCSKSPDREATKVIQDQSKLSIRQAAAIYNVPRSTLRHQINGVRNRQETRPTRLKLTQEEDSLCQWILSLDKRGASPRPSAIVDMVNLLLAAREDMPPLTVGVNWATRYIQRRSELHTRY